MELTGSTLHLLFGSRVWGHDTEVDVRSIDAHVRRLRAKLGPARHHVETVIGIGYRFVR